jgi:hypothetical protein
MDTAVALLSALVARGFVVTTVGTRLDVSPASSLTDEDRAAIRGHKPALLALLAEREGLLDDHDAAPPRTAAELVATLPHAPCHGRCGRSTAFGWECLSCRTSAGVDAL